MAKAKKRPRRKAAGKTRRTAARRKLVPKRKVVRRKTAKRKPAAARPGATAPGVAPRPIIIPGAWPFPMGSKP